MMTYCHHRPALINFKILGHALWGSAMNFNFVLVFFFFFFPSLSLSILFFVLVFFALMMRCYAKYRAPKETWRKKNEMEESVGFFWGWIVNALAFSRKCFLRKRKTFCGWMQSFSREWKHLRENAKIIEFCFFPPHLIFFPTTSFFPTTMWWPSKGSVAK